MKYFQLLSACCLINFFIVTHAQVRVLCTAALIDIQSARRKQEYTQAFQALKKYGYEPYIVENCAQAPSYLDQFSPYVLYTRANNYALRNKGVNECRALLAAIDYFGFDDEDIIVKITGRYFLNNDSFLQFVEQHQDCDAIVRLTRTPDVFTGCFALRCKYFKDMLLHIDYEKIERDMICVELEVFNYIKRMEATEAGFKSIFLDKLGVSARYFYWDGLNNKIDQW